MKRTSKALARIGIGAVSAVAVLSTPLALGTANADPNIPASNIISTPFAPSVAAATNAVQPALGTNAPVTSPQAPNATGAAVFYVYHAGTVVQNLTLNISGSTGTAYFPTQAGATTAPPNGFATDTATGTTAATCTTALTGNGNTACQVTVADTAPEGLIVTVGDTTDGSSTSQAVNFNGLHYTPCSQVGINTTVNCITQGQIATPTTVSTVYKEGGAGAANRSIQFTLPAGNPVFSSSQPAGTSFFSTKQVNCTTDASGGCSVTVIDNVADASVDLHATTENLGGPPPAGYGDTTADIAISFQGASVAAAELDINSSRVIAPDTQTAANGMALAEPGDVIQNVYTLRGATVPSGGTCAPIAPATVCPGVALANTTLTLKVSNGFFTPNCAFPTTPTVGPSLANNNYANCSFNTAPAVGAKVGDLKNSGQSIDLKTDANGQIVVSLGIAKDAGFDDDGIVDAVVSDGSIVPQISGDQNLPSSNACTPAGAAPFIDPATSNTTGTLPGGAVSGCKATTEWTTNEAPLNGGTAKDVVIPAIHNPNNTFIGSENNYDATDSGTNNVPDVDRVVFVVHLTDQFGNLTSNFGAPATNASGIQKTGAGNILSCTAFNSSDACSSGTHPFLDTTQPDGTVTSKGAAVGSYTNNTIAAQKRFEADANTPGSTDVINNSSNANSGNPGVNDGTQTDTTGWLVEVTTFKTVVAGTASSPEFATYNLGAGSPSVDTLTINFYNQLAQPVITFSVKPGHTVATGTGVTTAAKVLDQFNNPITDQLVQFVRTGGNESSCVPIQNGGGSTTTPVFTNAAGVAGYTFSCNAPGTSTVSIVVTGPGDTQLAQGKESVKFTGAVVHLTSEKPTLKAHVKGHKVTLKVATHPAVHGKTVHIYRLKHGLPHLVGGGRTNSSGHATLHLRLKHGTYHFEVRVLGLKATKFTSKNSKIIKVKV